LTSLVDTNPFILGTNTRVFNTQPGLPSYAFSYLDTFRNTSYQNYNSLQMSLRKQMTDNRWFGSSYFTLAYTYAKNMDNASGFRQNNSRVPYYDPRRFYAVSDLDIKHRIVFSGGWDLPFANFWERGPKALTKGWSLYPIVTMRTGFPIDVSAKLPRSRTRIGPSGAGDSELVRVNLVGGQVVTMDPRKNTDPVTGGQIYFSPSNFDTTNLDALQSANLPIAAGSGTYGTLGRNAFYGPGRSNVDMAIAKSTNLGSERTKLELRLEMFNMFNHAQFDNPNPNESPCIPSAVVDCTGSKFGEITTTAPPRIIQLGARFIF